MYTIEQTPNGFQIYYNDLEVDIVSTYELALEVINNELSFN